MIWHTNRREIFARRRCGPPRSWGRSWSPDPSHRHDEFDNVVDGSAIDGRTGNFLFTVGSVASGKSTLQNFLVHRLHVDENIHFDRTSRDGKTASEAYLNAWVHNIAAGYLPERTQKGVLREFNVRFGQRGRPNLDFSFIEIAGEDIRSIVPTAEQQQPKLNDHLERYLRQGGVNKRFLFISDASRNRLGRGTFEEDVLFDTLIRYLLSDTGIGLKNLNILFIAAKWDVVQNEYKSDRQYFRTNFPQTRSTILVVAASQSAVLAVQRRRRRPRKARERRVRCAIEVDRETICRVPDQLDLSLVHSAPAQGLSERQLESLA